MDVNKPTPKDPGLPKSMKSKQLWLKRGRIWRESEFCSPTSPASAESCRNNKIALIESVTDEQWPYLYHYGFIPTLTTMGLYRIHCQHGNNVSTLNLVTGSAVRSLCCYSDDFQSCVDGNVLMQLLALRTDPYRFVKEACTTTSVETRVQDFCDA